MDSYTRIGEGIMAVPNVETRIIKDKLFSKTLSGEISWRLIYDESGEVIHLFESTGIGEYICKYQY